MTTKVSWIVGIFAILLLTLGGREFMLLPDGRVHVVFLDVGQGDSALITLPDGRQILIDGGPDWSTLEGLGKHLPFFDRHIDMLILSHPNSDHMMSFPDVLRRYSVGTLVTAGTVYDSGVYRATLSGAALRGVPLQVMYAGQTITLGSSTIEALWPPKEMPLGFNKNSNNTSLTLRFTHEGKRVLFTGDLESIVEKTLVQAGVDLRADILKVPHHGSKSSSTIEFLKAVQPTVAVISVADDNTYGHPNADVLRRLREIGADIRRTDESGDIELQW
ncbi:MAG: MBL fold metallo-hydrolase [Candidatus Peribacteraceae bacterium]|nr:MBL fold metallo-hydrolase [Candidatus Peribacteraceae bacterium]